MLMERSVISFVLLYFTLVLHPIHYSSFLILLSIAGLYEILYTYNKTYRRDNSESLHCILYSSLPIFLITILASLDHDVIQQLYFILYYNSVSSVIQWITRKLAGFTFLFKINKLTAEGCVAGLLFTSYTADYLLTNSYLPQTNFFEVRWIILNLLGMIGEIVSSYVKYHSRVKHWSRVLLSHGGLNDRLSCWMIPSMSYIFYNSIYLAYYGK
jgi:predicted CDP-diglyceride synthetase/phosphatidate cytidylyltransferase